MADLRQREQWSPQRLAEVVEEMARVEIVHANYGTAKGGCVLKGKELLEETIAGGPVREVSIMFISIANTTQAELLMAALMLREQGQLGDVETANCAGMLAIAETVPGGYYDNVAFKAALARAKGNLAGSA